MYKLTIIKIFKKYFEKIVTKENIDSPKSNEETKWNKENNNKCSEII